MEASPNVATWPRDNATPQSIRESEPGTPEPTTESTPESAPKPEPEPTTESTPESAPEPEPKPEPESTPESAPKPEPEPTTESTPESAPEPEPEPESPPETEQDPDARQTPPHPRIQKLLDQPSFKQRSPEWFEQRKRYLTASSCAAALDIKPYASYKGSPRLELMQKLKNPDDAPFSNKFTDHGNRFENEALRKFEARYGQEVAEVGMMTNPDYPFLGASPDGLCLHPDEQGRVSAIELKCPLSRAIKPGVPEHYVPQIMVQMYVLDVDRVFFVEYKPREITWPGEEEFVVQEVWRNEESDRWWAANYIKLEKFWIDLQTYQLPTAPTTLFIPNKRAKREAPPVVSLTLTGLYGEDDDP